MSRWAEEESAHDHGRILLRVRDRSPTLTGGRERERGEIGLGGQHDSFVHVSVGGFRSSSLPSEGYLWARKPNPEQRKGDRSGCLYCRAERMAVAIFSRFGCCLALGVLFSGSSLPLPLLSTMDVSKQRSLLLAVFLHSCSRLSLLGNLCMFSHRTLVFFRWFPWKSLDFYRECLCPGSISNSSVKGEILVFILQGVVMRSPFSSQIWCYPCR